MILLPMLTGVLVLAQEPGRQRGERYALLVGVRRYDPNELRSLPYSEPDIIELAEVLKAKGYKPSNVVLMTQTAGAEDTRFLPLADHVRKELKLLLEDLEEEDSVLVALAGHGVRFRGESESYFCPADARLADKRTLLALSAVYKALEACRAGLKVLLVDACRNDQQSENSVRPLGGGPGEHHPAAAHAATGRGAGVLQLLGGGEGVRARRLGLGIVG